VREIEALGDITFALVMLIELGQIKQNGFNYCITGTGAVQYEAAQND